MYLPSPLWLLQVEKQPILDHYIPAHPVDRYTFKKWDTNDWARHNENKFFQSERDRNSAANTREEAKQLVQSTQVTLIKWIKRPKNNFEILGFTTVKFCCRPGQTRLRVR